MSLPISLMDKDKLLTNPDESATGMFFEDSPPQEDAVTLNSRVLLAEDSPDSQRLISLLLNKAGADVTVAKNGKVAFRLASKARSHGTPFDVILMDMQIPVQGWLRHDTKTASRRLSRTDHRVNCKCHDRRPGEVHAGRMRRLHDQAG